MDPNSIRAKLDKILQQGESDQPFIPRVALEIICTAENITSELLIIGGQLPGPLAGDSDSAQKIAGSSQKLFALLVLQNEQSHATSLVQQHGVTDDIFEKEDADILILLQNLKVDNLRTIIMDKVLPHQWLIPPVLRFGNHKSYPKCFIRPFATYGGRESNGSFGTIHKATVAVGHLSLLNGINATVCCVLVKRYCFAGASAYQGQTGSDSCCESHKNHQQSHRAPEERGRDIEQTAS
jgi:hypothetical protein